MGAWDWVGQLPGAISEGTGNALKGAFGLGKNYNLRTNPKTGDIENVAPDGTVTVVPNSELSQDWQLKGAEARRDAQLRRNKADALQAGAIQQQNTIAGIRETMAPQLAAIQQNGAIALKTLNQQGENAALDRAAIREQNEKNWQLRAQELGLTDKNQQLMYALKQQELADARQQYADTLAMRKEQMALDKEQAWRSDISQFAAMIGQGLGRLF